MPLTKIGAALGAAFSIAATVMPGRAQAFADQKTALVDYSKADTEPRKACEALGMSPTPVSRGVPNVQGDTRV